MDSYLSNLYAHIGPFLAIFTAAFLQTATGFGIVIVGAPLLMLFYDAKLVVPVMIIIAAITNFSQGVMHMKEANFPLIKWLFLGTLVSQPLAFLVFYTVDGDLLKLIICTALIFVLASMQMSKRKIAETKRNSIIAGFCAGFTSTTMGMPGPPFLIYLAATAMSHMTFRATCFVFFFACNMLSFITYVVGGQDIMPAMNEIPYLIPALVVGIGIGTVSLKHIPVSLIRKMIFGLLYLTCFYMIVDVLQHRM